jgi:hypothetical protein
VYNKLQTGSLLTSLPLLLPSSSVRIRASDLFQFGNTSEIMNHFRHFLGLLRRGIRPTQGLYIHRAEKHREIKTIKNIHGLCGI